MKSFPKDEKYDLMGQMRRSGRSIPSDISEGFGRFHFNDKLTFYERARASLGELRNHFDEALGNRYIEKDSYDRFFQEMNEIGYLLNKMMRNVCRARASYEAERKLKRNSSRRLPGLPKLLSEGGTSNAKHSIPAQLTSNPKD